MKKSDLETYYNALGTRDYRFDGKFFVGVKTTGIYCRPICPAKPKRENVEIFANHIEAEKAGYRPCLRCRPESAPQSPAWIGKSAIVRRATRILNHRESLELNENDFAEKFGVTARHLRRLFMDEIGKTPKQLFLENRLNLVRKLIVETKLTVTEAALAAGFNSVRRFNDAFKNRFRKTPSEIRRSPPTKKDGLVVSLPYRPPFNFEALIANYKSHHVGDLEWFSENTMHRIVAFENVVGQISISNDEKKSRLLLEMDFPDTSKIISIISRVRSMFDLDSDPVLVANAIETNRELKSILKKHPGIRVSSGWDVFEVAIGVILGQLVSVEGGRKMTAQLIDLLGDDSGIERDGKKIKLFPTPKQIVNGDLSKLKTTNARKRALQGFSKAIADGEISLEPTQDVDAFVKRVLAIPGIGPWTANYMALKCLRHTDTFPETDLILARALEFHSRDVIRKTSPWQGYAAALLWREYGKSLSNPKKQKERMKNENQIRL